MYAEAMRLLRCVLLLFLVALAVLLPSGARAQSATPAAVPPDSWAGQLDALSRWFDQQHRRGARCAERCFVLERLRLSGRVGDGPLRFELTGGVMAEGPFAVPLFGPPAHLRLDDVTEDGHDALIGFEGDRYYFYTAARRFVLKGALSIDGDLALTIPGPLNSLEAEVTAGAVVEGARLSGLTNATLHFSREGAAQASGPTVFQLSRALRVGREIGFEYRLVMRSGTDLGVVRLALPYGEKVLDVTGAGGWRVEGAELVLPTSGRSAEMTITGTLAQVGAFAPDSRSAYEWWLVESDPEHRVIVTGDARQIDAAESPIARTQATSRLFLVQRGQRIDVAVQSLTSLEVLAAVVRSHGRTMVLTRRGDIVSDDNLTYENNGIDYLLYAPSGRPIYLATDSKAERIMRQGKEGRDVLVPLRTGSHGVRVQALADAELRTFGGRVELPMPSYPLTASRVDLTVGVPAHVVPVALLGGDRPDWLLDGGDVFAIVLAFVVAWLAVRVAPQATKAQARRLRLLGGVVLAGLWLLWGGAYVAVVTVLAVVGLIWLVSRFVRGAKLAFLTILLLGIAGLVAVIGLAAGTRYGARSDVSDIAVVSKSVSTQAPAADERSRDVTGNRLAQSATGGVLEGVTPVALTLPSYAHSVHASRELVTRERPFHPVLFYVTDWTLLPLGVLWLVASALLLYAHREPFAAATRWVRAHLLSATPAEPGEQPPV